MNKRQRKKKFKQDEARVKRLLDEWVELTNAPITFQWPAVIYYTESN